jgi:hypothetical protein
LPKQLYRKSAFDAFSGDRDFAIGDARAQAWMCQLAYETSDPDKIKEILALWQLALVDNDNGIVVEEVATVLPLASTHSVVVAGRGVTIVAFAGTDPLVLANWISDFDAHIDRGTDAARGFTTAAAVSWPRIKSLVEKSMAQTGKVVVTGHSLGGALAVLTANRLAAELSVGSVQCIYTFGMPRAGDAAFAAAYDAILRGRTYRLVYQDDVVPTVAPTELGFKHVGRYFLCDQSGQFREVQARPDDPPFVRGISKQFTEFLHSPLSALKGPIDRFALAGATLLGVGPSGMRTDSAGILIELLPSVLRDHILDRYIGALGGNSST